VGVEDEEGEVEEVASTLMPSPRTPEPSRTSKERRNPSMTR